MSGIAAELPQPAASWPGIGAALCAFERAYRMRGKGHPEADLVGTRRHIVAVGIVGVRDPESGSGIVRRKQDMLGFLASRGLMRQKKVCRFTRQCRMTLGLDSQVLDDLVTRLNTVLHEEAVAYGVVRNIVFNEQIIRAMNGHAAVVGVVNRGVFDVLPGHVAVDMPVDGITRKRQVLA